MLNPLHFHHRKQLLADDKADLREFKERFLADGDLVEDGLYLKDGLFRKRKLAYMGSEASLDLFAEDRTLDSGGEDVDEDSDDLSELNRRKIRMEKEQYLRFMRVSTCTALPTALPTAPCMPFHACTAPCPQHCPQHHALPCICALVHVCRADRAACWMRMRRANQC